MRRSALLLLVFSLIALASCTDRRYYQVGGYAQGGTYSIKYRGGDLKPQQVSALADSLLREIDFTLSGYNKNSLLSRLNRGDSVVLTPMFAEVYRLSYEMWELSGGAFDAACGPLFDIWGFGFTAGELPSDNLIARTIASCGTARLVAPDVVDSLVRTRSSVTSSALLISGKSCVIPGRSSAISDRSTTISGGSTAISDRSSAIPDRSSAIPGRSSAIPGHDRESTPILNFNAIAQGYSCDYVYSALKSHGVTDMLVDIGEIRCCGLGPSGKGWSIGIDNPVDGNDRPGEDIRQVWSSEGRDCGVVTSGNYRKFYIRDGQKYSHTIDPRTGRPVQHNLLSATVIAPTAAQADALATYFMVVGPDAASAFLNSHPELQAFLITDSAVLSFPE